MQSTLHALSPSVSHQLYGATIIHVYFLQMRKPGLGRLSNEKVLHLVAGRALIPSGDLILEFILITEVINLQTLEYHTLEVASGPEKDNLCSIRVCALKRIFVIA